MTTWNSDKKTQVFGRMLYVHKRTIYQAEF